MAEKYVPPEQKGLGQAVDSIFLLVLVYCSLLAPLLVKKAEEPPPAATATVASEVSWRQLGQNLAMRAQ